MTTIACPLPHSAALLAAYAGDESLADCFNVMLDFDSTVLPLLDVMATCPDGSRVCYEDTLTWEGLADLVDGGLPRMLELFDEAFAYDKMRHHSPFAGAPAAIRTLAGLGVRFHVKTERPARFADDVRRYLADHDIPYVSFRCDQPLDKVAECVAEDIHIAADDHPRFIANATAAGIAVRTLDYPFNRASCQAAGVKASRDWTELSSAIIDAVAKRLTVAVSVGAAQ